MVKAKEVSETSIEETVVLTDKVGEVYSGLKREFAKEDEQTFRGGLTYIAGEAVISRLNDTLGVNNWDFAILGHGQLEKDYWVHGRFTARFPDGSVVVREHIGQTTFNPGMAHGDVMKGAATDSIKKCASTLGVGLYLSHKEAKAAPPARVPTPASAPRVPTLVSAAPSPVASKSRDDLIAAHRRGFMMAAEHPIDLDQFKLNDDSTEDQILAAISGLKTELVKYVVLDKQDALWQKYADVRINAVSKGLTVPEEAYFTPPMDRASVSAAIESLEQALADKVAA